MPEIHYFSNKFSKFAKCWEISAPSAPKSSVLVTWSYVMWPNFVFSSWLWRNQTSKNQLWRHLDVMSSKNITKIFHFGHPPKPKFLTTSVQQRCGFWKQWNF